MLKDEMKYWAGMVAACCLALVGAVTVPHPYDKVVIGLGAVAGAVAMYNVTPPSKQE